MQTHSTYSQLAMARADAADRQRRADAFRQLRDVEDARGFDRRRATVVGTVAGILSVGLLVVVPTSATTPLVPTPPAVVDAGPTAELPLPAGVQPGAADGWFVPDQGLGRDLVPPNVR